MFHWGDLRTPYPLLRTGDKSLDSTVYWQETGQVRALYSEQSLYMCFLCHVMAFTRSSILIIFQVVRLLNEKAHIFLHVHVSRVGWTTHNSQSNRRQSKKLIFLLQPRISSANVLVFPLSDGPLVSCYNATHHSLSRKLSLCSLSHPQLCCSASVGHIANFPFLSIFFEKPRDLSLLLQPVLCDLICTEWFAFPVFFLLFVYFCTQSLIILIHRQDLFLVLFFLLHL